MRLIVQHHGEFPIEYLIQFKFLPKLLFSCPTVFVLALAAYIITSINDGPGCLMLRCPDPSCGASIGQDMIDTLTSGEDKDKYYRYLLRSYIEDNKKVGAKCCQFDVLSLLGKLREGLALSST